MNSKDFLFVPIFCRELLKWHISETVDPSNFLLEVIKGLEKGAINNTLSILNLVSIDKRAREILIGQEIHLYILGLAMTCIKQDDKGDGKKSMWNLLINLSTSPAFSDLSLKFPSLNLFFEFFQKTKSLSCLRFLENIFWFSQNNELKAKYYEYSESFVDILE